MRKAPRLLFALLLASLFSACLSSREPLAKEPDEVRIAAWNMEWFPYGQPAPIAADEQQTRVEAAAAFVRWRNPDVLLASEVTSALAATNLVLSIAGDYAVSSCSLFTTRDPNFSPQQTAIISRYPTLDWGWERWQPDAAGVRPTRGFTWAVIDIRGHLILFCCMHLKSNYIPEDQREDPVAVDKALRASWAAREESARQMVARANALSAQTYDGRAVEGVFIGGDFNTCIFSDLFKGEKTLPILRAAGFRDCFVELPRDQRISFPEQDGYPASVLDYLLYRGTPPVTAPAVAPKQDVSDHCMISTALSVPIKK